MKPTLRVALCGAVAILVFDVIASVASRELGFPYRYAAIGSWLNYAVVAFAVGQRATIRGAVVATMFVGLVEASLGWWLSWLIGPGRWAAGTVTPAQVAFILVFVLITAGIIGGVSGTIGRARAVSRSVAP